MSKYVDHVLKSMVQVDNLLQMATTAATVES
uniref:Uncharacterized protein n=1 Tax=Megaselia scalaris TaxID=36166 RepID=T1GLF3_MEGSC